MLFLTPPQNVEHIRAFCARFNEGLRVEYKQAFDENVRRSLPKIVSSFANSLGGVCIIGVTALNGIPQQPINGFVAPDEELALTIENICLQGINLPIVPRITAITSDVANQIFIVLEVDESWESPHAIENSKRVYVRTGNVANPYDLSEVELIIELIKRRDGPTTRRQNLLKDARWRALKVVSDNVIHTQISIVPTYPRRPLCTNDVVWTFLSNTFYLGQHYYPFNTLRRTEDGVSSFNRQEEYSQVNSFGLAFTKRAVQLRRERQDAPELILIGEILTPLAKLLHCAKAFYARVGHRGPIELSAGLYNVYRQPMPFLPDPHYIHPPSDYECFEENVEVVQQSSVEVLNQNPADLVQEIIRQICWSFWQSAADFPSAALRNYLTQPIRDRGL